MTSFNPDDENESLGEVKDLAIGLHKLLCASNHTDACGFYYYDLADEKIWSGWTLKRWYDRAENALAVTDAAQVLLVVKAAIGK